jgi:hemolysin activation/secretion protein
MLCFPGSGRPLVVAATLLAGGFLPVLAYGQAYERVAPKTLPQNEPVTIPKPPPLPPLAAADQVLLPQLNGLVFVPDMSALQKDGVPTTSVGPNGINISGLPLLSDPEFTPLVTPYIGAKLTRADIDRIARLVNNWYREHDRPFVSVAVPPQNISSGVVQVVVSQYRVAEVRPEGNHWFSSDLLREESGLVPGQTLTLSEVQDDLDRLNSNPFRSVTTVFQPGARSGETDVVLKTEDRFPLRFYSSFDNAGAASLGRSEWSLGFNWGNALWLDQQFSYQFTRSVTGSMNAHSVSWATPLPWGDRLLIFGSFQQVSPDLGPFFGEEGKGGQASLRYVWILPRFSLGKDVNVTENLQIGYDFKTTNNDLEFGGFQVFSSLIEINQFPLIYEATETDALGQTTLQNQFIFSPGRFSRANSEQAFQAEAPGSSPRYIYDRAALTRITYLPEDISWVARVIGQVANGNLQYSEQLSAGGQNSVRGYYTSAAIGSEGVLVSHEIRAPVFSFSDLLGQQLPINDQAQFGVFWDWGHVAQVDPILGRQNTATLSSAGIDLHLTAERFLDLRLDMGWQLRSAPGAVHRSTFGDISATAGF